jgi:hypothetical protein
MNRYGNKYGCCNMGLSKMSIPPHRFGGYLSTMSPSVPLVPAILLLSPNLGLLEPMTAKQIPSTVNRIYDLIHHEGTNSGLNFAGCPGFAFPRGLWDDSIYVFTSFPICKELRLFYIYSRFG